MADDMNLNAANAKQKVKIFKAVIKEIKSKEIEIKLGALNRFKDCRYLTEGGSMAPLMDSVTVKKKTIDYSKTALDFLSGFLENPDPSQGGRIATLQAVKSVYEREGGDDLLPFRSLVDAMIYKEEVKKVKVKSPVKGQPPVCAEDPPEREIIIGIRSKALKCLYGIISVLTSPQLILDCNNDYLMVALAAIPDVPKNIIWVLNSIATRYQKGVTENCLEEGCWALICACAIFRYSSVNIATALPLQLTTTLSTLSKEKCYVAYCCQMFELLSQHNEGIASIATIEVMDAMVAAMGMCSEELFVANAASAAPTGKDAKKAAPPPADKKKGGKDTGAAPVGEAKFVQEDPNRLMIVAMRSASIAISLVSQQCANCQDVISTEFVSKIAISIGKVLTNQLVWQVCRSPLSDPLNYPIVDSVNHFARVVADLAVVSREYRHNICHADIISSLLSALQSSTAIIGNGDIASSDIVEATAALRRVLERSLLCLLTEAKRSHDLRPSSPSVKYSDAATDLPEININHGGSYRWKSCQGYTTDVTLFPAAPIAPPPEPVAAKGGKAAPKEPEQPPANRGPVPAIMSLILSEDADLSNHGWRLLYVLMQGCHHQELFAINNSIDAGFIAKSAKCFQNRLQLVWDEMIERTTATVNEIGGTGDGNVADAIDSTVVALAELNLSSTGDALTVPAPVDPVITAQAKPPSHSSTLFAACGIYEIALPLSSEAVNAFASKETIQAISKLLYAGGPICTGVNEQGNYNSEFLVTLLDLRRFFWDPRPEERMQDDVQLRPLLLDVLSIIAGSHSKYSVFEAPSPPPAALQPLPACNSPCREAAMLACRYCADACCSLLMTKTAFTTTGSMQHMVVIPKFASTSLHVDVTNAALKCLQCMGSGGSDAVLGILEGIAEAGLSSNRNKNGSLCELQNFLINADRSTSYENADNNSAAVDDIASGMDSLRIDGRSPLKAVSNSITSDFTWSRAQYFDQIYSGKSILTQLENLQSNRSLWPYISLVSAILGVVSNPLEQSNTTLLAMKAMKTLCCTALFNDFNQPLCFDVMCAVVLSIGGIIPMQSVFGRFGNQKRKVADEEYSSMLSFLQYLTRRGKCREVFWSEWAKAEAAKVEIDPKTGKPVVAKGGKDKGKDKKPAADKGKKGKETAVVSCVAETQYNDEPDEQNSDPNHGPSAELWTVLLRVHNDDYHNNCFSSSPLVTAVQSSLSELVSDLITAGADVNSSDINKVTPLMYSLLLNDVESAKKCLEAGANVDAIDNNGNPLLKYASLVIRSEDICSALPGYTSVFTDTSNVGERPGIPYLGRASSLVPTLIEYGVDTRVCDADGNGPLLWFLGLGQALVSIGGYPLLMTNAAYNSSIFVEAPIDIVRCLLKAGSDINFCNRAGVVPLHIAAVRGDKQLIQCLVDANCIRNPIDSFGFLPIHYTASACPTAASEVIDLLLSISQERPIERMVFSDNRTGKSTEDKFALDFASITQSIFNEGLTPASVRNRRLSSSELLQVRTDAGTNIVQLCMCAQALPFENVSHFVQGGKDERMQLTMHLVLLAATEAPRLICNVDNNNMNILHSACQMLTGSTPKRELTAAEIRSKRFKSYPSVELQILDIIFMNIPNIDVNAWCSWPIPWTALQATIKGDNVELAATLISRGAIVDANQKLVHFAAAANSISLEMAQYVVELCAGAVDYNYYLNALELIGDQESAARPIHIAVRTGNLSMLEALLQCPKCDINARDELTGMTAVHEACQGELMDAIKVFKQYSDRIDLLVRSQFDNTTCVDAALQLNNAAIVNELITMRRNDVVEWVLTVRDSGISWLDELERVNIEHALQLGYTDPDDIPTQLADDTSLSANDENEKVKSEENAMQDDIRCNSPGFRDQDSELESSIDETRSLSPVAMQSNLVRRIASSEMGQISRCKLPRFDEMTASLNCTKSNPSATNINDTLQNEVMVRLLIKAVNEAGFTSSDAHAHQCFAKGLTFIEYCRSK